jgi:hypothetical protein
MGVVAIDVWVLIQPGRSFFTRLCCACELWLESFREQRMVIGRQEKSAVPCRQLSAACTWKGEAKELLGGSPGPQEVFGTKKK